MHSDVVVIKLNVIPLLIRPVVTLLILWHIPYTFRYMLEVTFLLVNSFHNAVAKKN